MLVYVCVCARACVCVRVGVQFRNTFRISRRSFITRGKNITLKYAAPPLYSHFITYYYK
jgi:hypothetical protein